MGKIIDLTGKRFGRLFVIERAQDRIRKNGKKEIRWKCICDCGTVKDISGGSLRSGNTRSCGCLAKEINSKRSTIHGGHNDRLYSVWQDMKSRCSNKNDKKYHRYGGRGITVCDEWADDYSLFKEWAINSGYDESAKRGECTIDRIDVNKGYCPDNCRFTDVKTQNLNKENTVKIKYQGKVLTLKEWSSITGINESTLRERKRKGWPPEKMLSTKNYSDKSYYYDGKLMTTRELSDAYGIKIETLRNRLGVLGWSVEKSVLTPVKDTGRPTLVEYKGEKHSLSEWARIMGTSRKIITNRLKKGIPFEDIIAEINQIAS